MSCSVVAMCITTRTPPNPYREGEETECDVVFGSSYVYYNKDPYREGEETECDVVFLCVLQQGPPPPPIEKEKKLSVMSCSVVAMCITTRTPPNPYREGEETECDVVFGSSYVYYNKDTPTPIEKEKKLSVMSCSVVAMCITTRTPPNPPPIEKEKKLSVMSCSVVAMCITTRTPPHPYREGEETECDVVFGSSYVYYNKDTPPPPL